MTKSTKILVLLLAVLLATFAACDRDLDPPAGGEVTVVTTTYPLTFIAGRIGGDRVAITQLVKPGVEAHDFEPAPSDIRTISDADLFIFNHPALEGWALNAASASSSGSGSDNAGATITLQTVFLESAGEDHGGQAVDDSTLDAHVWLNPLSARDQSKRILAALVAADPDGSFEYVRNADALGVEFQALDEIISRRLNDCELDSVVVSHLAFGHMAERYKFNQIGLAGLSPEFESGPAHIASAIESMIDLGIQHVLQEPIASDRLAETVAAETGAQLLQLHPLEVRTREEASNDDSFFDIMKANAEALHTAMRCS
jgi:zinc transport system substrate-binding protein